MLCFYLEIKKMYKQEIVFLKKVIAIVYANSFMFIKFLISGLEGDEYQSDVNELRNRKVMLNEENISENNEKLIKMLTYEVNSMDSSIKDCLLKIWGFISDFTLNEAFKYMMDVFGTLVD